MPADSDALSAAATGLLARLELTPEQTREMAARALDPAYWRGLNPKLSACGEPRRQMETGVPLEQMDECAAEIARHGYFHREGLLDTAAIAEMRAAVETLCAHGWLPVFGFLYDEFWQVTRGPAITRLLTSVLGPGYLQRPGVWSHRVKPLRGAAGWEPHVDGYGKGETKGHFSLWLPLSEGTLENGCMCVIPRDLVAPEIAEHFAEIEGVTRTQLREMLQVVHALPAQPGAVLGWDFNVIHWGSVARGGGEPRVSIAVEFVSAEMASSDPGAVPFRVDGPLPTYRERLAMVAQSVVDYARHETVARVFVPVAEAILKSNALVAGGAR